MKKNTVKNTFFTLLVGILLLPYFSFANTPNQLTVSTMPATNINQTSATLKGFYNAGIYQDISVRFEWGDTPLMLNSTNYQILSGSGNFEETISIQPGKTYFFRAMGVANGFTPIFGSDLSFTSPLYAQAIVQTMPATNITNTSANLNGFYNGGGSTTETRFEYANNSSFIGSSFTTFNTMSQNSGNFSKNISGLQANTTYYFRAIAKNSAGTTIASTALSFTTINNSNPPTTNNCVINSFFASPSSVQIGNSTKLFWSTTNCTSVSINQGIGNVLLNGEINTGNLFSNKTYTITASNGSNEESKTLTVTINSDGTNNNCRIDSFYSNKNYVNYGQSVIIYWETSHCNNVYINQFGNVSNDGNRLINIYGNTTFYINAYGQNGSDYDSLTVYLDNNYNPNPPFYQNPLIYQYTPNTIVHFPDTNPSFNQPTNTITYISTSGDKLINIEMSSSFESISSGERFEIKIKYKNTGNIIAKNGKLFITLPKNLVFERSTKGEYNRNDHTLFVSLGNISTKTEDIINIQVKVSDRANKGETLITTGTLSYQKGEQKEEVIGVLTNKVNSNGSVLGALAIGGFSGTLIGWLVAVLMIMIIYAIARQIYKEKRLT